MHQFIYNKQMKTKTVLTESVVETTYNHNKSKQSQWQIKEELYTAQRTLGTAVSIQNNTLRP
jgi:hypothetical protein